MLDKLTPEQEALIPVVRDEWIKFCLGGETSVDKEKCIEGIEWIYSLAKLKRPEFIAFAEGPLAAQLIFNLFPHYLKAIGINKPSVRNSVENSVWNSVRNSVWNSVWNSVEDSVRNSVEDSVWNSVENSVRNSVENSVWNSVRNSVENSVWNSVENFESPYCGLGWWAGWFSFYDYFERIGISTDEFKCFRDWAKTGIWETLWFENLCVVVCRPSIIKKNSKDQLHCTNGPSAQWPSGEVYWFLNGIQVNEKIVMHPEKLTKKEILGEKNVDVRREMLRQIGMERFCALTSPKVLDRQGDYELLSIDLSDTLKDCRYLKMKNPSISVIHIEGVERECDTVQKAINWRAGDIKKQWKPVQLT